MSESKFISKAVSIEATSEAFQISKAFGLNALKQKFFNVPSADIPDSPDTILPEQTANNLLSNLVYDTVTFMGNGVDNAITYFNFDTQSVVTVPKMQIPISLCMVEKNIKVVKSEIAGRNGTIKQFINQGDFNITIRALFTTGVSDKYPVDAVSQLNLITNATSEVKVASTFLNYFGIKYIVFERMEIEQNDNAGRDEQKVTINAISEKPYVIKSITQGGTTSNGFGAANTSVPLT